MSLTLNTDRTFRICQLTDIHLGDFPLNAASQKTLTALDRCLSLTAFDLIMITGDLIWGTETQHPERTLGALFDVLNRYPIPVAITYGNHDTEGHFTREQLRALESKLSHPAPKQHAQLTGDRENYTLEVIDNGEVAHVIYVWDSGAYSHWPDDEQYAAIEPEQISWFLQLPYSRLATRQDIGFLHIPLPEYAQASFDPTSGACNEAVCSALTNSGLFYTARREQTIKAFFAGHDHDNNFTTNYHGIGLNYGNVTGYNTYGQIPRGIRTITLYDDRLETAIQPFE